MEIDWHGVGAVSEMLRSVVSRGSHPLSLRGQSLRCCDLSHVLLDSYEKEEGFITACSCIYLTAQSKEPGKDRISFHAARLREETLIKEGVGQNQSL